MLTLANIIEWEQLTGKRLQEYDGNSVEDMAALGYVQYAERRKWTFAEYREAILTAKETKELESVARRAALEFRYIAQFNNTVEANASGEKSTESVTEICGQLITNGIDGNFLLSRGLEDLRWLTRAAQQHEQRRLENSRFWAYLHLSPYIDKNKVKNAKEFLPFAWEAPLERDTITELDKKLAKAFFGKQTT